jgi:hypothetical protein
MASGWTGAVIVPTTALSSFSVRVVPPVSVSTAWCDAPLLTTPALRIGLTAPFQNSA